MNIVCIIQARMGSSRLPGKVLMDLAGKPGLLRVIARVLESKLINHVVIATTTADRDQAIVDCVDGYDSRVSWYRGSEDDVLDRYYHAAVQANADIVVRITSDCPMIDPEIVDQVLEPMVNDSVLDYSSNVLGALTFPRGLDTQAIRFSVLEHIWNIATEQEDREHVTLYVRKHPEQFKTNKVTHEPSLSFHRWTVDEPDDYRLMSLLYERLIPTKPHFRMKDVLEEFDKDPELIKINQQVQQKMSQY
jgi:spore coat polysaccharide biosynthesis protein SpsF (cytidylyltransferase family)